MVISVAAARINKGMTQTESAKALRISKNTYVNYENGKTSPSVDMAGRIAALYDIPLVNLRFSK